MKRIWMRIRCRVLIWTLDYVDGCTLSILPRVSALAGRKCGETAYYFWVSLELLFFFRSAI